ncbi:UNVERIFIED_CONTAM: protein DCL, chloroplastic [Sesamum angustifolium]|uniref:Protein DCL, chloroplastic n=1 Tax=Sesamum angustifolium TaxID=2727405 RepID=A0AAW2L8Z4_9LAMI
MAAPLLLRALPLLRLRLVQRHHHFLFTNGSITRRLLCSVATGHQLELRIIRRLLVRFFPQELLKTRPIIRDGATQISGNGKTKKQKSLKILSPLFVSPKKYSTLIGPLTQYLVCARYMDGERLTPEDEKAVLDKLLAHHPHSEDKIGCGLDSIMVDRHPQFRHSRCLFVVRTDGGWIDFSYQKCLRAYIRDKYPSQAERFISEHFKCG